jgi:hypothetical protein
MYTILLIAAIGIVVYVALQKNTSIPIRERYQDTASESTEANSSVKGGKSTESSAPSTSTTASAPAPKEKKPAMKKAAAAVPMDMEYSNKQGASVDDSTILNPNVQVKEMGAYPGPFEGCFPKQKELKPEDLLPKDMNTKWAQVNPSGQGMLADRNFLDAGHHVGINTVGQTLRNANYSVRSEIPNPQIKVSPWMQSTIDPDVGRKPLEIGAGW